MFTVTGQVLKTFIQPGQLDKETGKTGESSIKVQIMGEMPVQGGESRLDLITLTVQDKATYDALNGKKIRVPLGFFAPAKGQIIYFIPKGSQPELVTEAAPVINQSNGSSNSLAEKYGTK
jgi:hypothetical protein